MGALFHRERTGEATTVDVSLLGIGMWSMGAAIALSLQLDMAWKAPPPAARRGNPLVGNYRDQGRPVRRPHLPPGLQVLARGCARCIGRPELATDERFADAERSSPNGVAATELLREVFAERTARRVARAARRASSASGRWCRTRSRPPPTRRPSPTATSDARPSEGDDLPAGGRAGAVRRRAGRARAGAGVQRARRRHPRGARPRLDAILDLKVKGVVA